MTNIGLFYLMNWFCFGRNIVARMAMAYRAQQTEVDYAIKIAGSAHIFVISTRFFFFFCRFDSDVEQKDGALYFLGLWELFFDKMFTYTFWSSSLFLERKSAGIVLLILILVNIWRKIFAVPRIFCSNYADSIDVMYNERYKKKIFVIYHIPLK